MEKLDRKLFRLGTVEALRDHLVVLYLERQQIHVNLVGF